MSDDTQSLIKKRQQQWRTLTPDQQAQRIQDALLRIIDAERSQKRRRRGGQTNDILFPQKRSKKSL